MSCFTFWGNAFNMFFTAWAFAPTSCPALDEAALWSLTWHQCQTNDTEQKNWPNSISWPKKPSLKFRLRVARTATHPKKDRGLAAGGCCWSTNSAKSTVDFQQARGYLSKSTCSKTERSGPRASHLGTFWYSLELTAWNCQVIRPSSTAAAHAAPLPSGETPATSGESGRNKSERRMPCCHAEQIWKLYNSKL